MGGSAGLVPTTVRRCCTDGAKRGRIWWLRRANVVPQATDLAQLPSCLIGTNIEVIMTRVSGHPVDSTTLAKRGGTALVLSLVVNVALVALFLELALPASTEFFGYESVIVLTTLGVIGATVVYYLLSRQATEPNRTFTIVAVVVLFLSFLLDVGLIVGDEAVATSEALSLAFLHIPPAVFCIGALTGWLFELVE